MESKKKIDFLHICFLFFALLFMTSCEDLFLRFKYQTIDCQENSFNLKKISIKKDTVGSFVDVQFGDIYHKIKVFENNNELIILKNKKLDIEIEIQKNNEKVEVRLKNIIKRLNCKKTTFKM